MGIFHDTISNLLIVKQLFCLLQWVIHSYKFIFYNKKDLKVQPVLQNAIITPNALENKVDTIQL